MTNIAYMVREDWAQFGTAMEPQSAVIRDWLGAAPYLFAASDLKKYTTDHDADREFVTYIAPNPATRRVFALSELGKFRRTGEDVLDSAVVILHPYKEWDCALLRDVIAVGRISRIFVIIWARSDMIRTMLDGLGALDLHTSATAPPIDPIQFEAARCMVNEQYNGLSSGNGKDAVVQLIRAFSAQGYPLDVDAWLRTFYAAGGEFDEAEKVAKLIKEMQQGVKHRVKQRYRPEIFEILRARVTDAPPDS